MADRKGMDYEILENITCEASTNIDNKEHRIHWRIDELLKAADITHEESDELQMKTNRLEDTKDDKLKLDRYFIKLKLGVDTLDEMILSNFQYKYYMIQYFLGLIDEKNLQNTHDNHLDELRFKIPIVNELIHKLGFNNIFDTSTEYLKQDVLNKIDNLKNTNIFSHDRQYYKIFSTSKDKLNNLFDSGSLKAKLGVITQIIADFALKIEPFRIQEQVGNKTSYYKLVHLNNISEIIENKSNKGVQLYDKHNIYKRPNEYIYQHLMIYHEYSNILL